MDPQQLSVTQTLQENPFMNVQKRVLTAAVAATLGAAALPSAAMIPGVAGEALLVPMAVNDPDPDFGGLGYMNTYVQLRLPAVLGSDFVLNNYTTPNLRAGQTGSVTLDPDNWTVYWTWYDPRSTSVVSGSCEGSPNDAIIWTTDADLLELQEELDEVAPYMTYCGDSTVPNIGYVVFQTFAGADALAADFAMEGNAWITDSAINYASDLTDGLEVSVMSIPVFPMADGEDPDGANADTSPRLGANEVIVTVSSDGGTRGDKQPASPVVVSPLGSGVRMNNGDPNSQQQIDITGSVQAPLYGQGYSMHVLWFDQNNPNRPASQNLIYDEHEQRRDFRVPIEDELNVIVYNMSYLDGTSSDWTLEAQPRNLSWYDLIDNVPGQYPEPRFWDLSTWGYVTYLLQEEGTELGGPGGTPGVNSAAVFFEAQELYVNPFGIDDPLSWDAWTMNLMTLNGFR
jgi:hypothetical protein